MAARQNNGKNDSPLVMLYKILCDAVFDDEYGANETTFNALMVLGDIIDKKVSAAVRAKTKKEDGRYRYADW